MPSLTWIGKEAVVRHHREVPFRLLEPVRRHGQGGTGNLLVQGDNLDALKALLPRYAGQVKCVYIDPPYNTGNEKWAYNDNVNSPQMRKWLGEVVGKEGETLDRHDRWLCMMYPRLLLLRQFLREDGAIFISIDDNEQANLRLLCDEIFGGGNFVASVVWKRKRGRDNSARWFSKAHEYLLVYAKRIDDFNVNFLTMDERTRKAYKNPDNDPRGDWRMLGCWARGTQGGVRYAFTSKDGRFFPERLWLFSEENLRKMDEAGKLVFRGDNIYRKMFITENSGNVPETLWDDVSNAANAADEIKALFNDEIAFNTPKPVPYITRILQIATDKDSLILDSFAGSGTTGHAVLKLNAEDGGHRRFILVEMDPAIAQNVTEERLRRVCEGYANANAKGEAVAGLGGGFEVCRLSAEPLFGADGQIRQDVTFAQLADFVWFHETGTGYSGRGDSPFLGEHEGRGIYLLYNGILGDLSAQGGNVLTRAIYAGLPKFAGPKTVYAAAVRGAEWLRRENIEFKQTPYAIERETEV